MKGRLLSTAPEYCDTRYAGDSSDDSFKSNFMAFATVQHAPEEKTVLQKHGPNM